MLLRHQNCLKLLLQLFLHAAEVLLAKAILAARLFAVLKASFDAKWLLVEK